MAVDDRTFVLYDGGMTRLWVEGLAVQVQTDPINQPAVILLNGRRYRVERVVEEWEVDTDWWSAQGRAWRRHYAVLLQEVKLFCVLRYDVLAKEWRLERIYD